MRPFQIRPNLTSRANTAQRSTYWLAHGSLLVMQGATQLFFQHRLPRRRANHKVRINATFRQYTYRGVRADEGATVAARVEASGEAQESPAAVEMSCAGGSRGDSDSDGGASPSSSSSSESESESESDGSESDGDEAR